MPPRSQIVSPGRAGLLLAKAFVRSIGLCKAPVLPELPFGATKMPLVGAAGGVAVGVGTGVAVGVGVGVAVGVGVGVGVPFGSAGVVMVTVFDGIVINPPPERTPRMV